VYEKLAQEVADASIAELMGGAGGEAGGMDVDPAALMGAGGEGEMGAGGEGEMVPPEGDMGGGGEISPEELEAALQQLIAEGQLTEEEATEVLEFISSGGAEGGAEAGGEAVVEEPAAPDAGGMEGMEAQASAQSLLTAIQSLRQSRT